MRSTRFMVTTGLGGRDRARGQPRMGGRGLTAGRRQRGEFQADRRGPAPCDQPGPLAAVSFGVKPSTSARTLRGRFEHLTGSGPPAWSWAEPPTATGAAITVDGARIDTLSMSNSRRGPTARARIPRDIRWRRQPACRFCQRLQGGAVGDVQHRRRPHAVEPVRARFRPWRPYSDRPDRTHRRRSHGSAHLPHRVVGDGREVLRRRRPQGSTVRHTGIAATCGRSSATSQGRCWRSQGRLARHGCRARDGHVHVARPRRR